MPEAICILSLPSPDHRRSASSFNAAHPRAAPSYPSPASSVILFEARCDALITHRLRRLIAAAVADTFGT